MSPTLRTLGLFILLLAVLPPAAAQDLPLPGEGAFSWSRLGDSRQKHSDILFTDDGDLLSFDRDLYRYDFADGAWTEVELPAQVGVLSSALALGGDTLIAGSGVARSLDAGVTWEYPCGLNPRTCAGLLSSQTSHGLYDVPHGPYAGRLFAPSALYSDDRGASWTEAIIHAEETNWNFAMYDFAAMPSGRMLAAGEWGVAASDDGGESWTPTSHFGPFQVSAYALAEWATPGSAQAHAAGGPAPSCGLADPLLCEGAVVLNTSTTDVGVRSWWTNDGGRTWTEGTPLAQEYDGVAWGRVGMLTELDRSGTSSGGSGVGRGLAVLGRGFVHATVDGGVTWQVVARAPLAEPISTKSVHSAEVGPDGRLYVGVFNNHTSNEYVWVSAEPAAAAFDAVQVSEEASPETGAGGVTVSPNLGGGALTVRVDLPAPSALSVSVFDTLGRLVATLHDGDADGPLALRLDGTALAPGVYVVRAVVRAATGTEVIARTLTIAR